MTRGLDHAGADRSREHCERRGSLLRRESPGQESPAYCELSKEEKGAFQIPLAEQNVRDYDKKRNLRIRDREKRIANGAVIEILAVDQKTREIVGLELRAEEADDGSSDKPRNICED